MKPAAFCYHRARDVDDATALLAELGDDAKVIAGGQSLVAMMNFRLARPGHLVDIARLRELDHLGIDADGGLRIGALTTHHTVETAPSRKLGTGFDVIRDAMAWIGHLPIRTRGTVGGSIAHGDTTAEWCLLAVLLDAEFVAQSPRGRRRIPADGFFFGYYTTALEPDEILVEVVFPRPAPHAALTEFAERRGDFAIVSAAVDLDVAVDLDLHAEGSAVRGGRVALGGVAAMPVRVPEAEAVLADGGSFRDCAEAAAAAVDPPSDANGSTAYRKHLVRTLVERACKEAVAR
ncbi:FAD binding domain-containing protein [Actinospica sp.]|uniref:FAD binding domain-containing protein n=1 Tax=Actinospica sp. TaxID=1872142 RepID=UPI002B8474B6|nr:FAD binding domain-containing protein [Actinospica sp.]HWG23656.1 FAD binding domain-containing protein [Actinospica sp.]